MIPCWTNTVKDWLTWVWITGQPSGTIGSSIGLREYFIDAFLLIWNSSYIIHSLMLLWSYLIQEYSQCKIYLIIALLYQEKYFDFDSWDSWSSCITYLRSSNKWMQLGLFSSASTFYRPPGVVIRMTIGILAISWFPRTPHSILRPSSILSSIRKISPWH